MFYRLIYGGRMKGLSQDFRAQTDEEAIEKAMRFHLNTCLEWNRNAPARLIRSKTIKAFPATPPPDFATRKQG